MPKVLSQQEIAPILEALYQHGGSARQREIAESLAPGIPERTLQYRLRVLIGTGRVIREGQGRRWARYRLPETHMAELQGTPEPGTAAFRETAAAQEPEAGSGQEGAIPLSPASQQIRQYVNQPLTLRKPAGYNREFLDGYQPNVTFYLSAAERARLAEMGSYAPQAAGTYSRQVLGRLLIDLSWNSSRLEGNTYSLLDTRRLLEFGQEAKGRDRLEAQMIVNHKEAIDFLVGSAEEIGFNRYTILNLHAILAHNLLPDEAAAGRLRHIAVGIEKSTFHPLAVPHLIEECFNELLRKAAAIEDPFEQAFFFMVQLPFLRPFDDVNRRVSRLAANLRLIRQHFSPLSFTDVPRSLYTAGMLGVYELNAVDLLKDVFLWGYRRSAQQYMPVQRSLGEPDPFRFRHSADLRQIVSEVVRGRMNRAAANAHIAIFAERAMESGDQERFREMAEAELLNLHEGNFARHHIRPGEFAAWQEIWVRQSI